jgi:outer membrane lipoprotein-sorting protein
MKHVAVFASGLLAVALARPALAQDNEGEKLFRAMEKKIRADEPVEVAFTYQVGNRTAKGSLLLAKDNKARLRLSGNFGDEQAKIELVSDGKRLKTKGAKFFVGSNGKPGMELGGQTERVTPKNFNAQLRALVSRGGMWFTVFVMPYLQGDGIDPDDESSKVNAYDFKLAGTEKVGGREAKVLRYRFGKGGPCRDDEEITLWIDGKTLQPLKRNLVLKGDSIRITESYRAFMFSPKMDAKTFRLPQ